MLRESLETLLIPFFLLPNQLNIRSERYILQNQDRNPAVYAQGSKQDLGSRFLEEADRLAEKNPKAAIPIYGVLIKEEDAVKEEAIRKLGNLYKKMIIEKKSSENDRQSAFKFYKHIVEHHQDSPYFLEAYINYGGLKCCLIKNGRNLQEGADILEQAYKLMNDENINVDKSVKINLLHLLGDLHYQNAVYGHKRFSIKEAKKYYEELIELAPESDVARYIKQEILTQRIFRNIAPQKTQ